MKTVTFPIGVLGWFNVAQARVQSEVFYSATVCPWRAKATGIPEE